MLQQSISPAIWIGILTPIKRRPQVPDMTIPAKILIAFADNASNNYSEDLKVLETNARMRKGNSHITQYKEEVIKPKPTPDHNSGPQSKRHANSRSSQKDGTQQPKFNFGPCFWVIIIGLWPRQYHMRGYVKHDGS